MNNIPQSKVTERNEFGLPIITEYPPMPTCKPPRTTKKLGKKEALERIRYLINHLPEARSRLDKHTLDMIESSILIGKPIRPCLTVFDNLERICREIEMAIESIEETKE